MAYMEASLVTAKTLWHYDFERISEPLDGLAKGMDQGVDVYPFNDMLVASHDGPYLRFHSLRS